MTQDNESDSSRRPERPMAPVGNAARRLRRQEDWKQTAVPFATSLLFHGAILGLLVLLFAASTTIIPNIVKEQIIIPDAAYAPDDPGGVPNPGMDADPNQAAAQNEEQVAVSTDWTQQRSTTLTDSLMGGEVGENSSATAGPNSTSIGISAAVGGGAGGNNALAPFGMPGGGGGRGPQAPFMGMGGNAKDIVYVCDATGTMMGDRFNLLILELKKAVQNLDARQSFNVVFYSDGETFSTFDNGGLVKATTGKKQELFKWLDGQSYRGQTNPIPALGQAFKFRPDLMYFMTDGRFDNLVRYEDVIAAFEANNRDKRTKVNTILLEERDENAENTLQTIARQNGGNFKFVTIRELLN